MSALETIPVEFKDRVNSETSWREIVRLVDHLPPMPHIAVKALSLADSPRASTKDLNDLLLSDVALVARTIRVANSVVFAQQKKVTTLPRAIQTIGFKGLKSIILATVLRHYNRNFGLLDKLAWENAMSTAMACVIIARRLNKKFIDEVFLLGLLHNLGQVALLSFPTSARDYKKVIELIAIHHYDYCEAEQQVFGSSYTLIGALLAQKWSFSKETCQAILHHNDPLEELDMPEELLQKVAVLKLGDLVAKAAGIGIPEGYPDRMEEILETASTMGFDIQNIETEISEIITQTKDQFTREHHLYE